MPTLRQIDPTATAGIQRMYGAELVRRLAELNKAIRISLIDHDALGLVRTGLMTFADPIPPADRKAFAVVDSAAQQRAFSQWLSGALAQMLDDQGPVPAWLKTFVRAAYSKGIQSATRLIEKQRKDVRQAVNQILSTPFHRERLEGIFERNFAELKGLTGSMATKIQRALADGLTAGENPRAIATRISKEISISKSRARTIARTETIRTNAEAQLNTFERFGIAQVSVEAEWLTAEDGRVCPLCEPKNGKIFSIEEARGMIPLHPNCRCGWVPVNIEKTAATVA